MNIRLLYASIMTLFALLTSFYAVMTLAFFFGETNKEWLFPLFITTTAVVIVWTTVSLWRKQDSLILSSISTFLVAGITGWIIFQGSNFSFDVAFFLLIASFMLTLVLLGGLFSSEVRTTLQK